MVVDNGANDGQAKARSTGRPRPRCVASPEAIEQMNGVVVGNAGSVAVRALLTPLSPRIRNAVETALILQSVDRALTLVSKACGRRL